MQTIPSFEPSILVTDDPVLAARTSALFRRPRRYFPVLTAPRLGRKDAGNELTRCINSMVRTKPTQVLVGGVSEMAARMLKEKWRSAVVSDDFQTIASSLRGRVAKPSKVLHWGPTNLGVGVYKARLARMELCIDLDTSPHISSVDVSPHLLVACEAGDGMAEVIASNLAFACNASYTVLPAIDKPDYELWKDELYEVSQSDDPHRRIAELSAKAAAFLSDIDFSRYKAVLFVTSAFPWGIALPGTPTTHMYRYPDFGRAVIDGIFASSRPSQSARTALLLDPHLVDDSEIPAIRDALLKNDTLTTVSRGPGASVARTQLRLDLISYDIIVLASHAGEAPGTRITYEFLDAENRMRRLVVDEVMGIGTTAFQDKFSVTWYHKFHALDGVLWTDDAGKAALPVGSAIEIWTEMDRMDARKEYIKHTEAIPRVRGSMGIDLSDGTWLYVSHGFPPNSAPIFVNNTCWSWHELSQQVTFSGARGYIGSLFPISDTEANVISAGIFQKHIGKPLMCSLSLAQRDLDGPHPYVMVGLPFVYIGHNLTDSVSFANNDYAESIAHWTEVSLTSPHQELRENAKQYLAFLHADFDAFKASLSLGRK